MVAQAPLRVRQSMGPEKTAKAAEELRIWLRENGLVRNDKGRQDLSMDGLSFLAASGKPRRKSEAAWDEIPGLLARMERINLAPANRFPIQIHDAILFGSMVQGGRKDYGDADILLVMSPKGDTYMDWVAARQEAAEFMARSNLAFDQDPSFGMDWNALAWRLLRNGRDFLSMNIGVDAVETFHEQKVAVSCVSLTGKKWTPEQLDKVMGYPAQSHQHLANALDAAELDGSARRVFDALEKAEARADLRHGPAAKSIASVDRHTAICLRHPRLDQPNALPKSIQRSLWWISMDEQGMDRALELAEQENRAQVMAQALRTCGAALPQDRATANQKSAMGVGEWTAAKRTRTNAIRKRSP